MNKYFNKDISIRIISVLLAVFLWLVVLNSADPFKKATFVVQLELVNEASLQNKGLILANRDFQKSVAITVRGREKVISSLSQGEFSVKLDFSKVNSEKDTLLAIEPPVIIGNENKDSIQIVDFKPIAIPITLDKIGQNPFRVEVVPVGNLKSSYKIIKTTVIPEKVSVEGIDSEINSIAAVKAFVDVNNLDKNLTITKECKVFNKNDEELIDLNKNLKVDVKIEVAKEVTIIPLYNGTLPESMQDGNSGVKTIRTLIVGKPEVVSEINELYTILIDTKSVDSNFDISEYVILPEGVKLVSGSQRLIDSTNAGRIVNKSFKIQKDNIRIINPNTQKSLKYEVLTENITIILQGTQNELNTIDIAGFMPRIDVNTLEAGIHRVPLKVNLPGIVRLLSQDSLLESTGKNMGTTDNNSYLVEVKISE